MRGKYINSWYSMSNSSPWMTVWQAPTLANTQTAVLLCWLKHQSLPTSVLCNNLELSTLGILPAVKTPQDICIFDCYSGSNKKVGWKLCSRKHKKVEQALRLSLRNLFEQLAWRIRQLRCFYTDIHTKFHFWVRYKALIKSFLTYFPRLPCYARETY